MTVFGAPQAHEDDPERALRAALELQKQGLKLTVGINTGPVYFGRTGSELDQDRTVMGPVVNLAIQLQAKAGAGQILVGEATHRQTWRAFRFRLGFLDIEGFSEPVPVNQLVCPRRHPEKSYGIAGLRAELIGRDEELARLEAALGEVRGGQGQVALVIGQAGIGKSRLVAELKQLALTPDDGQATPLWLEGRCLELGTAASYWPFIDIFRTHFAWKPEDDELTRAERVVAALQELVRDEALSAEQFEEIAPLLGNLLSLRFGNDWDERLKHAGPEQIRHQTLLAIRDFLVALTRQQPLVLVLEDLHWADGLSLDLISLLMEALPLTPLLLLCVYRPERQHRCWHLATIAGRKCPARFLELHLRELTRQQSRQLVESLLYIDNLPASVKELILAQSQGNPFFVEEVIRSLVDADLVYRAGDIWRARAEIETVAVPESVQSVIQSRVDRLEPVLKHVLQRAAVIGRLFRRRVLAQVTPADIDLEDVLWELEDQDLIYEEQVVPEVEYSFQHVLTQQAVYQTILRERRADIHRQVAEGLEGLYQASLEGYYEHLAYHYDRSDTVDKAVEYLFKAGEKARRAYLNDEAVIYYSRALELTPEDDRVGRYALLLAREQVYDVQSARELQGRDLETLRELAAALNDDRRRAEAALRQSKWARLSGNNAASRIAAQEVIRLAKAGGVAQLEAAGYVSWADTLSRQGDYKAARSRLEQALALARDGQLSQIEAESLIWLGVNGTDCGRYAEAKALLEQSLRISRKIGDRKGESTALRWLAESLAEHGEENYPQARACYEQALQLSRAIGFRNLEGDILTCLGYLFNRQGEYHQARTCLEQAMQINREDASPRLEANALACLAETCTDQGDYPAARRYFQQSLRIHQKIGMRLCEGITLSNLGLLYHLWGDDQTALRYSRRARRYAQEIGARRDQGYALTRIGHALAGLGQLDEAAESYRQALAVHRELDQHYRAMEALAGLACLSLAQGNLPQALAEVEEILGRLGPTLLAGTAEPFRIYLTCYRVLRAHQDPRAQAVLNTAYELLQERAAKTENEALRRSFLENVTVHREIVSEIELLKG